jgi:hypothetical protein
MSVDDNLLSCQRLVPAQILVNCIGILKNSGDTGRTGTFTIAAIIESQNTDTLVEDGAQDITRDSEEKPLPPK